MSQPKVAVLITIQDGIVEVYCPDIVEARVIDLDMIESDSQTDDLAEVPNNDAFLYLTNEAGLIAGTHFKHDE